MKKVRKKLWAMTGAGVLLLALYIGWFMLPIHGESVDAVNNVNTIILLAAVCIAGGGLIIYRIVQRAKRRLGSVYSEEPELVDSKWRHRALLLAAVDVVVVWFSCFLALMLRFDIIPTRIPYCYLRGFLGSMPYWSAITLLVFYKMRLYHSIWRFAGMVELRQMCFSYVMLAFLYMGGSLVTELHMPRSYYLVSLMIGFLCHLASRFAYRILRTYIMSNRASETEKEHVMIVGAGRGGQMLLRELITSKHLNTKVCCLIDDNPYKHGLLLEGVPVVGNRYDIPQYVEEYKINRIIYAIPTASGDARREILNICHDCGCQVQILPGMYQLVNGEVNVNVGQLRNVEIQDLLGREQAEVNNEEVLRLISGLTVLVTGGGGSIGSELCRQIAANAPKELIIFDMYENNAYDIQNELLRKYPELHLTVLIGSVRDSGRMEMVMSVYKPDIVFHAAAHKHVPLMEDSPNEAIKNNVMGTFKTAKAAANNGVKKFVLISSDKAVNPTNIMGASKRLCEMVVQMMNRRHDTEYVAVRFGNVLGSNGSVIPLFKKQIEAGGPVTVTDKNIIRYFMTIPEAVGLVLQASHYAKGGEIFVLDMGDPVRIDDMARNLIRLSGFIPDEDIQIVYTGLRPGEKLFEELLMDEEGLQETENKLIHIGKPIDMDDEWFLRKLEELNLLSYQETDRIRELVGEIVPTYTYEKRK